jgi:3-hydroxyacyl-CoA dehydrogenase
MEGPSLKQVAVIGAGGKMGGGIALLLLQQMSHYEDFTLYLVDANENALKKTMHYLKEEITRYGEKKIALLRERYQSRQELVSNLEMIEFFVSESLMNVQWGTSLYNLAPCTHIFEAIIEDETAKVELFKKVETIAKSPWYFTNTSSIPIHVLEEKSGIQGRIVGFHFYNPPAIQKLVELIFPQKIDPKLKDFSFELAKKLGKDVVVSKDVAGFIGNGHFLREISYATTLKKLTPKDIYQMNVVTEKFLVRPMGIFRLMDYVGVDVVLKIASVMRQYLKVDLPIPELENIKAFFKYESGQIVQVFDIKSKKYVDIDPAWEKELGTLPPVWVPWKKMTDPTPYLKALMQEKTPGALIAKEYLKHSKTIGENLIQDQVAANFKDVDFVLRNGFYHSYGLEPL